MLKLDIYTLKKNLTTDFISFTKINSKWISDLLIVKLKIKEVPEDKLGENLDDFHLLYGDNFLMQQQRQES